MSHEPGTYLGGIRDLGSLMGRCYCDPQTQCWHFRTARGRAMPKSNRTHAVWVTGRGSVSVTRVAYEFATGKEVPDGMMVFRACSSYDCINPKHLRLGTSAELGRLITEQGRYKGQIHRLVAARQNGAKRRKISAEMRVEIVRSTESGIAVARRLGLSSSIVYRIREQARQSATLGVSSIFALGQAAANAGARAAA